MKIISLVENTTSRDLPVEHGLSLWIETDRHRILFDTGQSGLFCRNAERLGVDLKTADLCFLSHGHYDHGGGLKAFVQSNHQAKIYMNRNAFDLHYSGKKRYIGLEREWISDLEVQERICYTEGPVRIDEQLSLLVPGAAKRVDMGSAGLYREIEGEFFPDDFRDEQYLLIEEQGKRVLFSGCSHQGVINITEWFRPDVLIGGFHFMKQELDGTLAEYGRILDAYDTEYITCHCTGTAQYEYLKPLIRRLRYLAEGETIEV